MESGVAEHEAELLTPKKVEKNLARMEKIALIASYAEAHAFVGFHRTLAHGG
jgi:hypothetical protein